jgi:hypothetical protein
MLDSTARRAGLAVAIASIASALAIVGGAAASQGSVAVAAPVPDFGPSVKIFTPDMPTSQIRSTVNAIADQQLSNEFGTQRYALLFMPGTYGSTTDPLNFQVGYYTEVGGLGASPKDVRVTGTIDSYNRCTFLGCNGLLNFWRSLSNLTLNVAGKSGCRAGQFWANSQGSPIRRVQVNGHVTLTDYCGGLWPNAAGSFIADSRFSNGIFNGLAVSYLVRNSSLGGGWTNAVWNQVFAGVEGAPAQSFPSPAYTTLARNPASREKPFLYVDPSGAFRVHVPAAQFNSSGTTWQNGQTPGHSIPIEDFFIARPTDSAQAMNDALSQGKHLLFTPGVYKVDRTIKVDRANTIVLGLGMATLVAQNGVVAMTVADVPGVEVSGLIFDAGPVNSPVLLQVGSGQNAPGASSPSNPTALHDVYFRIGGPHVGKATVSLVVNSDNVILDHIWAWRADHGSGMGWTSNTAETGVVVNGDDVVATRLNAEHYQKYSVIWNGENGKMIMFANELPADPPNQGAWQHDGVLGYAAYKVGDAVKTHEAWGLISDCVFVYDTKIRVSRAFEVPVTPGVRLHGLATVSLLNMGTIERVVNDVGTATNAYMGTSNVASYP